MGYGRFRMLLVVSCPVMLVAVGCAPKCREDIRINWRMGPELAVSRGGHAAMVHNGEVWAIGGTNWEGGEKYWLDSVEILDRDATAWRAGPKLSEPVAGFFAFHALRGTTRHHLVILGGGKGKTAIAEGYALAPISTEGKWSKDLGLPAPRLYGASVQTGRLGPFGLAHDPMFVVGGTGDPETLAPINPSLLKYEPEPSERGWQAMAPMPRPCVLCAAAALTGKIYVFGGCIPDKKTGVRNLDDAAVYDVASNTWQRLPPTPFPCRCWAAVVWKGRYVLLLGGYAGAGEGDGFSRRVIVFDAAMNVYLEATPMPLADFGAAATIGNRIFVIGGEDQKRHRTAVTMIGDIVG